jgi:twinkle protein
MERGTPLYKVNCVDCGSSDAKQIFEKQDGSTNSYCFACEKFDPMTNDIAPIKSVPVKPKIFNLNDYSKLPSADILDRGLKKETVALFGVKLEFDEATGKISKHYYPDTKQGKVTGYEVRSVADKLFSSLGDRRGAVDLWGREMALKNGSNKLFITEGRCDAMALYQCIVENTAPKYKNYLPSVVSLTRGASGGHKDIINNRSFIEKYREVVLVLDNDKAGEKVTKDILKSFPSFKVCKLPLKDANDMLLAGRGKELYQAAVWDSTIQRLGETISVDDALIEEALTRPVMGLSYPWPSLDRLTYGIRESTIIILGAAPKQGKSEFKNQLVHHLTMFHGKQVGVYDLEAHPIKTLKQVASKEAKTNFLKPDNVYCDDLLRDTLNKFKGKISLYDRAGSRNWEDIRVAIEEQYLLDGIQHFFLDPLSALVSRLNSSEGNDELNLILTDMADLVNKYPITIFAFTHLNPKMKGVKSHEEGGKVLSQEFSGSRACEKWSNLGLGIERDRSDACPEEKRNYSKLKILYCRDWGNYGSVDMFYNTETTEYLEPKRF